VIAPSLRGNTQDDRSRARFVSLCCRDAIFPRSGGVKCVPPAPPRNASGIAVAARGLASPFLPESATTLSPLDTVPGDEIHDRPRVPTGEFSPATKNRDCEEIATPSTAYGRRRRNWQDARGSVPAGQVVGASCGHKHCIALRHSYLRPRVEQPGTYPKIAKRCSESKNRSALRCSGCWLRGEEPQAISPLLRWTAGLDKGFGARAAGRERARHESRGMV
jgi:hypothetical protein